MNPAVFVEVTDKYLWALKPFAYLFNIYWSQLQPVVVYGFKKPDFNLPPNFSFYSISPQEYPAKKWSNAFISFLKTRHEDLFVLLLADYWLCRSADVRGISSLADYMREKKDVLRLDLTADRLYAGGMFDLDFWGSYDVIETPPRTPYQFSLQAAIWNRENMLELLVNDKSPWEVEIETEVPGKMRVLGTRQWPLRYANALLKGKMDWKQLNLIPREHRQTLSRMIPEKFANQPEEEGKDG